MVSQSHSTSWWQRCDGRSLWGRFLAWRGQESEKASWNQKYLCLFKVCPWWSISISLPLKSFISLGNKCSRHELVGNILSSSHFFINHFNILQNHHSVAWCLENILWLLRETDSSIWIWGSGNPPSSPGSSISTVVISRVVIIQVPVCVKILIILPQTCLIMLLISTSHQLWCLTVPTSHDLESSRRSACGHACERLSRLH